MAAPFKASVGLIDADFAAAVLRSLTSTPVVDDGRNMNPRLDSPAAGEIPS
jgi:hypothetical protein